MSIFNMIYGGGGETPSTYKTYTIVWNETSDPSQFFVRYEDDAAWLTQGSSDFDDFFWYSAVLLDASGNEVSELTQTSWVFSWAMTTLGSLTWTANNVMIKFPRRWIKMSKSWTQVTLSITDNPDAEADGYQYYAFTKWSTVKDYMYMWAYMGSFSTNNSSVTAYSQNNTYLKSWATSSRTENASPAAYQTRATFRATAAKYWNWYSLMTWYPRNYINALYMMKYWNPDSQSVVWQWYTWWSASIAPWGTKSQTSATYWTSSSTTQARLFWLEDWWGNVYEWMDGCYFNGSTQLTVDKTNNVFQDSDYATNLGATSSWYMSAIAWDNDGMFQNKSSSAWTSTTYYADSCGAGASRVLNAGGAWGSSARAGAFYLGAYAASNAATGIGSRLMFL